MRRRIPAGSVFRKNYKDRHGKTRESNTWFVRFHLKGKPIEISTGTSDYDQALTLLREKMAAAAQKSYCYTEDPAKVKVNQLLDLVLEDYRENNRNSTDDTQKRIDKHLRPFFGHRRASEIGTKLLKEYRRQREATGDAEATVNKELTWLRRGFRLGVRHEPKLVHSVPYFPITDPDNTREGTIPHEKYREVRNSLPPYARVSFVIAYHTGARKGEIRKIRREMIDWTRCALNFKRKRRRTRPLATFRSTATWDPKLTWPCPPRTLHVRFSFSTKGSRFLISKSLGRQLVKPLAFRELCTTICAARRSRT